MGLNGLVALILILVLVLVLGLEVVVLSVVVEVLVGIGCCGRAEERKSKLFRALRVLREDDEIGAAI